MQYIHRQIPKSDGRESFFLFGPRGTGKSLWLQKEYPEAHYIDLLSPDTFRRLQAYPERLNETVGGIGPNPTVIIDEVQRVPELLSVVHQLLEKHPGMRFILTGSSTRKLKQEGVDLLAGRAVLRRCHPFLMSEINSYITAEDALQFGLVPLVITASDPRPVLASYIDLYLREEIQQEGLVRNLGSFTRFLETISFSHGSVLNQSEVARESEVERKTVAGYLEILEHMLLSCRLPIFTKRAKRQLIRHVKFYLFDAGVFRQIRPKGPLDRPSEIDGMALEGLVLQHLRAWADYSDKDHQIYYWRTKSGTEVDFIVYGETSFVAIEVKNSLRIHRSDLRGLKTFMEDYPEARPLLVYRGKEQLKIDGIICQPWNRFLTGIRAGEPLP